MGQIILENMEFYAYHGHFPEEQIIGGRYSVDLTIETDLSRPAATDDLADTVDYCRVYELVNQEMQKPAKIIEHVAGRIIENLKCSFKQIQKVTVRISKLNPPVRGQMTRFSVVLTG